jgi:hypothetical protein
MQRREPRIRDTPIRMRQEFGKGCYAMPDQGGPHRCSHFLNLFFPFLAMSVVLLIVVVAISPAAALADAPTGKRVRLAGGRLSSGFRWTVEAFREGGASGAARPCVSIELSPPHPEIADPEAGDVRCQRPSLENLDAFAVVDEFSSPKTTLLAIVMPPAVRSASLYFNGPLNDRAIALRQLPKSKGAKTGLAPFRYGAFAFSGDSCLSRLVLRGGRDGEVLYAGERMHCRG